MAKRQQADIDPTETIEISASASQLLGSFILTVLASIGVGAAVWLNVAILTTPALIAFLIGMSVLVGLSFLLARLMLRSDTPVVTISPEGVRDIRLSEDMITWQDIEAVRTLRNRQVPGIELILSKQAEKDLTYKPLPRLLRNYRGLSSSVRYAVSAHGVKMRHQQLLATLKAYAEAHGPQPQ